MNATEAAHAARDAIKSAGCGGIINFGTGVFDLNGEVHIDAPNIFVEGELVGLRSDVSFASQDNPQELEGRVLRQNQAGPNMLRFEHANAAILFSVGTTDMILTCESSLRESDTGHGVFVTRHPDEDRAIQDGKFKSLRVVGHDRDQYAYNFEHCQNLDTD